MIIIRGNATKSNSINKCIAVLFKNEIIVGRLMVLTIVSAIYKSNCFRLIIL